MWWRPATPDDVVPGRLVVDPDGNCRLELIGGLDMGESTPHALGDRVPVVLGKAEGQAISLFDCFVLRQDGLGRSSRGYQDIHVHEALVGVHVEPEEQAFQSAIVTLEHLTSWLATDGVVAREGDFHLESAIVARPEDASCVVDGWTITARALVQPFQVSPERSRLTIDGEISRYLVLRPPTPASAHKFHGVVLELMDLLTLASGAASGQIQLTLIHKDPVDHPNGDGTFLALEQQVESFGAHTHTARPTEPAVSDRKFRFRCSDLPFEQAVPAWLSVRRRAPEACNVFFGMSYARPTFTEVRLLMTAITAETLHQSLRGDVTELPAEVFAERRARILENLPDPAERQWARALLQNRPSLRERLVALALIPDGAAVARIIPDVNAWARSLTRARNNLAHTGNENATQNIFDLERATNSLLSLVFMSEMGVSADAQASAARDALGPPLA